MRLLILGGTGFIGPHLVKHALSRGHAVTIFTRGRRDGDLPSGVTRLVGDRNGQLGALAGGKWDAVIDDSATNPDWVKQSTALLKDSVGRYLFTSSTGVYYPYLTPKADESVMPHANTIDPKDSGRNLRRAEDGCEAEVMRVFGDRGLVVRPTYIVGPGDTSDRFPYWAARLPKGGKVLAPGRKDDPVQWIDVRDLVAFYIRADRAPAVTVFSTAWRRRRRSVAPVLRTVHQTLNPKATMVHVDDYTLLEQNKVESACRGSCSQGTTCMRRRSRRRNRRPPGFARGRWPRRCATRRPGGRPCPRRAGRNHDSRSPPTSRPK